MKASRIVVGKGRTTAKGETEWLKEYFEVEVIVEDEKQITDAKNWAESLIDGWLEVPVKGAVPVQPQAKREGQIPNFDSEDLMKHEWKGKRIGEGYAEGSLSWGWDFADEFKPATLAVLERGPETIGEYVFSLSTNGKIVNTKKAK